MTERVFKYVVPVDDQWHTLPITPSDVLHVECQNGPGTVEVWALDHEWPHPRTAEYRVFGTGHPLPDMVAHVGSSITAGGALVWHLFSKVVL